MEDTSPTPRALCCAAALADLACGVQPLPVVISSAAQAHDFLQQYRETFDPRGGELRRLADILVGVRPWDKHRVTVAKLMDKTGARPKFILRKLAAAILPSRKRTREPYMRKTLAIRAEVNVAENRWTKQDAYEILCCICDRAHAMASIPRELRTRVRVPSCVSYTDTESASDTDSADAATTVDSWDGGCGC